MFLVTFLGPMAPYLYAHVYREKICKVLTIERLIEIVSKSFWELHSLKCCDGWIVEGLQVKAEITVTQTLLWTGKEILGASLQFHCIHGFIDKSELHFVFQFYTMHNVDYSDFIFPGCRRKRGDTSWTWRQRSCLLWTPSMSHCQVRSLVSDFFGTDQRILFI